MKQTRHELPIHLLLDDLTRLQRQKAEAKKLRKDFSFHPLREVADDALSYISNASGVVNFDPKKDANLATSFVMFRQKYVTGIAVTGPDITPYQAQIQFIGVCPYHRNTIATYILKTEIFTTLKSLGFTHVIYHVTKGRPDSVFHTKRALKLTQNPLG